MKNQQPTYQDQLNSNEEAFLKTLQQVLPELHIIAVQLRQTSVNPATLFAIIRHMAEIAQGTGYGQIVVDIQEGEVKIVRGMHQTKVNERVLKNL